MEHLSLGLLAVWSAALLLLGFVLGQNLRKPTRARQHDLNPIHVLEIGRAQKRVDVWKDAAFLSYEIYRAQKIADTLYPEQPDRISRIAAFRFELMDPESKIRSEYPVKIISDLVAACDSIIRVGNIERETEIISNISLDLNVKEARHATA